jgi:hypothetical protein
MRVGITLRNSATLALGPIAVNGRSRLGLLSDLHLPEYLNTSKGSESPTPKPPPAPPPAPLIRKLNTLHHGVSIQIHLGTQNNSGQSNLLFTSEAQTHIRAPFQIVGCPFRHVAHLPYANN